jgi:hypothetical protein
MYLLIFPPVTLPQHSGVKIETKKRKQKKENEKKQKNVNCKWQVNGLSKENTK